MPDDEDGRKHLPDEKEERDDLLTRVVFLAPLLALILQFLELLLKILDVID